MPRIKRLQVRSNSVRARIEVANVGTARAEGPFDITLFLSEDNQLDSGDLEIDRVQVPNLGAGRIRVHNLSALQLPPISAKFVVVKVDAAETVPEAVEDNNLAWQALSLPVPEASLEASRETFFIGQPVQLTWSSRNADRCNGTNFDTEGATSGNTSVVPPFSPAGNRTTYTLTCSNAAGSTSDSVTVTVIGELPVDLRANPRTVERGDAVTLTWSSEFTRRCDGTNFSTAGATSGITTVRPERTTTYTVTCFGGNVQGSDSVTVTVETPPPPPLPEASLEANPSNVDLGDPVTLTWSSVVAERCTGENFDTGGATSATTTVVPPFNTTYTVTCTNSAGSDSATVSVTVLAPPPPVSLRS